MAQWLMKTEPDDYSWDRLVADGGTDWTGVRNYQAALNMRAMKQGDRAFFYRSMVDPAVLGIMEIAREHWPAADDPTGKFVVVGVKPVRPLPQPVSLASIKQEPRLAQMVLLRQSRLSVQPVGDAEWALICAMGGLAS
ncbi:MAG: EVE domain-containing protein [Geminicoccaceae bacterium]